MKTQRTLVIALALSVAGAASALNPEAVGHPKSGAPAGVAKAAGCQPAVGKDELDLNNVRALIETGGSMWLNRDQNKGAYEVPKTEDRTGPSSMFSGALWMGGLSPDNQLKLAAVQYRTDGNDFWPGPLTNTGDAAVSTATCLQYDRTWKTLLSDAEEHEAYYRALASGTASEEFPDGYSTPSVFYEWPAIGDVSQGQDLYLAPFYDNPLGPNGADGYYNPDDGDYPGYDLNGTNDCRNRFRSNPVPLYGDQNIWWVFNDKGNTHTETSGQPIGMEIHAQAFAFSTNDEVNNMTFYNYVLINQGTQTLTNTYFGQYADPDLGCADDDFVGCDVQRGLGYVYNWDEDDQSCNGKPGYGSPPPAVGIDFFEGPFQDTDTLNGVATPMDNPGPLQGLSCNEYRQQKGIPYSGLGVNYGDGIPDNERFGMTAFVYFARDGNNNMNDPGTAVQYYSYLRSRWKDNTPMTYGGTGYSSDPNAVPCRYMFPGDSDPLGWGTNCSPQGTVWAESAQVNPDRRFIEASGPFTLLPGSYNNITVGVVWARGANRLASVDALKVADDKAQALFDNCFRILDGPDAPDVTVQELDRELILYLSNPKGTSNNYYDYATHDSANFRGYQFQDENYIEKDPTIPDQPGNDRFYHFQGYKVYQVADATVGPDELNDVSRARLLAQCDLRDTVKQIINWIQDPAINLAVPTEMVNGGDSGIVHSFKVTQDLFATGDPRLVNFKTYHYMAIAYGYNNWQDYSPASGQASASGQPFPYKAGRKAAVGSIHSYSGIPHKPAPEKGGTVAATDYGDEFQITRLEGQGNGGLSVLLDRNTENAIMAGAPWRADELHYQLGRGPVQVKVVDPLKVPNANFELAFIDTTAPFPSPTAFSSFKNLNDGYWRLVRLDDDPAQNDTVYSKSTLGLRYEQLILDWGISITVEQTSYSGTLGDFTEPVGNEYITDLANLTDFWYSGIPDVDGESPLNWIRSGESNDQTAYPDLIDPNGGGALDKDQVYEKLLSGTWTAGMLVGDTSYQPGAATRNDAVRGQGINLGNISESPSVMVVFTPDKSKWTRCPVLEEHDKTAETTPAGTKKLYPRPVPSVDKNGRKNGDAGYNAAEGDLTSAQGMGWFPGYAIDLEAGERLNMAFGENSSLFGGTIGKDMIWNPNDQLFSNLGEPIFGGSHWIYVFKNLRRAKTSDAAMPQYDEGAFMYNGLTSGSSSDMQRVWRSLAYVGSGLLVPGKSLTPIEQGLIPSELRLVIDVNKPYTVYQQPYPTYAPAINPTHNNGYPLYTFNTQGQATQTNVASVAESSLDLIGVVPNPYYAFSGYETSRLDNRVKFINLPEVCTISIYTVNGTLVRKFRKDNDLTYVDWDLRNSYNVPIAGGTYICHIDVPGVGERVIKWFGVIRPVDLTNF